MAPNVMPTLPDTADPIDVPACYHYKDGKLSIEIQSCPIEQQDLRDETSDSARGSTSVGPGILTGGTGKYPVCPLNEQDAIGEIEKPGTNKDSIGIAHTQLEAQPSMHKPRPTFSKNGISRWEAVIQIVNLYIGFGVVLVPSTVAIGGWLVIVLIPLLGFVAAACALILCWSFDAAKVDSFSGLADAVGGAWGRRTVNCMLGVLFFYLSGLVQRLAWDLLVTAFGLYSITAPNYAIALGSCSVTVVLFLVLNRWPTLNTILSKLGTVAIVIVILYVLSISIVSLAAPDLTDLDSANYVFSVPANLPLIIPILVLNFSGAGNLPLIRRELRDPKDFLPAVMISFGVMIAVLSLVGGVGYAALGEVGSDERNILLTFPSLFPR